MSGLIDVGLDLGDIVEAGAGLLGKFITDKDEANRLSHELMTMGARHQQEQLMAQLEINKQEAAHKNLFVAGWRPAVGWLCASALAMNFIVTPLFGPLADAYTKVDLVPLDLTTMLPVLLGMLGLGGMRSIEKVKKVARER